jgi:hypothetical protein
MVMTSAAGLALMIAIKPKTSRASVCLTKMKAARAWANLDVLHRESFERLASKFSVPAQDDEGLNPLARFWHELPA